MPKTLEDAGITPLPVEELEDEIKQKFLDNYRKRLFDLTDKRSIAEFCREVNIERRRFHEFLSRPDIQKEIAEINNELMMTTWNPTQCLAALTTIAQNSMNKKDGETLVLQAVNTILKTHHENRKFVHKEKVDDKKLENAEQGKEIMRLLAAKHPAKHKVIEAEKDDPRT